MMVRKIVITGPESTGKSTLARKLALHFDTLWVPEYAREYIDRLDRPYDQSDLVKIARGQLQREDQIAAHAQDMVFIDTELTVIRIWYRHRFGGTLPYIEQHWTKRKYDLYLLPDIDLPWKYDPQREHPHLRGYFMNWYRELLEARGIAYHLIRGNHAERFEQAVRAVQSAQKKWRATKTKASPGK